MLIGNFINDNLLKKRMISELFIENKNNLSMNKSIFTNVKSCTSQLSEYS